MRYRNEPHGWITSLFVACLTQDVINKWLIDLEKMCHQHKIGKLYDYSGTISYGGVSQYNAVAKYTITTYPVYR